MERLTKKERNSNGTAISKKSMIDREGYPTVSDYASKVLTKLADYEDAEEQGQYGKWIPVSERLPNDGDLRFYMCIVENHEEDLPMFCQYEEDRGFGFWRDYYDGDTLGFVDSEFQTNEELGYEKVVAWMPLPEPYRESGVENGEVL